MIPQATLTVTDFASPDLASVLGSPPAGTTPQSADEWAAGVAQAVLLAQTHKVTGPGLVTFEARGKDGEVVVRTAKMSIAQPLETARVAEHQAARLSADRAKARKVVQAVPSVAKAAAHVVKAAAAVVAKGVSTVVGAGAPAKPAAASPAAVVPLNTANRPAPAPTLPRR